MTNRLKELILKRARYANVGMDVDGDILCIFGKTYYVNVINDEVMEIK